MGKSSGVVVFVVKIDAIVVIWISAECDVELFLWRQICPALPFAWKVLGMIELPATSVLMAVAFMRLKNTSVVLCVRPDYVATFRHGSILLLP